MLSGWDMAVQFLAALIAMLNPLGNIPVFLSLTKGISPKVQRLVAALISLTVFALMVTFLAGGEGLLKFFGISVPAFRIAGGILILLTGIGMVSGGHQEPAKVAAMENRGSRLAQARMELSSIMVPLVIPIIAGPGAMTTAILYGERASAG